MAEGILTPAQLKAAGRALESCTRCRPKLEYLRNVGLPAEEEEKRLEHLSTLANTMIELHEASKEGR